MHHSTFLLFELPIHFYILNQINNIINLSLDMFLLTRTVHLFTKSMSRVWSQANPIFKDYYSRRLNLTPNQLQRFLLKASIKEFSQSDHRWISLLQNIQISLPKFQLQSRLYMLKALVGMQSRAELVEKLMQSILIGIKQLNFEQASLLLWCLSKCQSTTKMETTTKIYEHLCSILLSYEDKEGNLTILISKQNKQLQQKVLILKSTSVCMVLSAMANLGISEKTLLKHLLKSGIRANLAVFATNGLVTLFVSMEKLGLRNRKDALFIFNQIRRRYKELQTGPIQSVINLAWATANFSLSKHFQIQNKPPQQAYQQYCNKIKEGKQDLKKFLLWLCETITLRQKFITMEMAAKILHYCGKAQAFDLDIWSKALSVLTTSVQDCKIIDLVMAVRAITRMKVQQRKQISKQQQVISKRLWVLHSSLAAKSLDILSHLYSSKKINPPPRFAQVLKQHILKKEVNSQSKQANKEEKKQM